MRNRGYEEVSRLMEKFLEGATNNIEEARLQEYFKQGMLSEDMAPYAEMMEWYAVLNSSSSSRKSKKGLFRSWHNIPRRLYIAGAAAVFLGIAVAIGLKQSDANHGGYTQELLDMYEGSYIVRGGKKETDLKKILPTILEMERCASKMRSEARSEFTSIKNEMYDQMQEFNDMIARSMATETAEE